MSRRALAGWLQALEKRTPASRIDLGLDRVRQVWQRLDVDLGDRPVITIAGTNGKGSAVAMIEAMLTASGHVPFAYTSPHLLDFTERMRIGGEPAGEASVVAALERVESARGDTALTYFEQITLAALVLAADSTADTLVLEVGLGGRLDAVNLIDADVAVITSIGLDHGEWLGRTRSAVGREKAGVARAGRPAVVGDKRPPEGLIAELGRIGARVVLAGRDFDWRRLPEGWRLYRGDRSSDYPRPAAGGRWQVGNAAVAITALEALGDRLAVPPEAVRAGLERMRLSGRFEQLGSNPDIFVDVAHNPAAARALAASLGGAGERQSLALFSALEGKDVRGIGRALDRCFSHWLIAGLAGDRGRRAEALADELKAAGVAGRLETVESVPAALERARDVLGADGRLVVFGSFRTVAEALPQLTPPL